MLKHVLITEIGLPWSRMACFFLGHEPEGHSWHYDVWGVPDRLRHKDFSPWYLNRCSRCRKYSDKVHM